jgi:hypothetical protein
MVFPPKPLAMPLRDHFRPPLSERRHWHSFHSAWATFLASALNDQLPAGYFAEPNVQFGIEIDVAAFEEPHDNGAAPGEADERRSCAAVWSPPQPMLTIPFSPASETVEVLVFSQEGGPRLAGALELVSPANKDRVASRNAFTSKCESYLTQGIGLVIVDVVTSRQADLHAALVSRLRPGETTAPRSELYAAAYRPVERNGSSELEIWREALTLGEPLPTLPLWLLGGLCLPAELEATYERTCREHRIAAPA